MRFACWLDLMLYVHDCVIFIADVQQKSEEVVSPSQSKEIYHAVQVHACALT